jgi:hypothetical protein
MEAIVEFDLSLLHNNIKTVISYDSVCMNKVKVGEFVGINSFHSLASFKTRVRSLYQLQL